VLRAIPDEVVVCVPAPSRKGRRGPAPPPPPDVLGPVLRVVVLAAAITGLRQSELLGLRWRDVDWVAQRIRVRNTFVRGEHSTDGKSDLSIRRSVPMADRLAGELDRWSKRTAYKTDDDLVFAHPQKGTALDRSKVTRRFKAACRTAGVREVKFHDLRHTFATRHCRSRIPARSGERVEKSDLPSVECSPRTNVLRTRMRCATQSSSASAAPAEPDRLRTIPWPVAISHHTS
jgi:integrase